ncbi:MAG: aldehyde dehydrogenase family protein [Planctomycetota bacterium]|jgi:acyl-CoA reductase-like NAD-dependent aldehyde dehydrogenase
MAEHIPLLIAGGGDGATLEVTAPFDGAPLATLSTADASAVDRALATAAGCGRPLPVAERVAILTRAAAIMRERAAELALGIAQEGGKPLVDSEVEVARAIDGMALCIETIRTQHGREIPMQLNAASAQRIAFTRHEPIGVVVAVSAFNHPLNLIVHQVAPAVATGCPVIVKPAEDTPISCMRFVEILREAGLPEEWCQALTVSDLSVATKLVTDPRVRFFTFIGSSKVGWMLRSQLAPGTRCALEHGGAAPVIVTPDADPPVEPLAKGGFYHAGQVCVSVQRVFASREFAEELAERASALRVGDPTSRETEVGPLIRHREVSRVAEWVNEAGGALCGAKTLSESTYAPTVLWDPPADAKVSTLEVFGPVVCVYPYDDFDEACARANALPVAFQAAVFTKDLDLAMSAYSKLDASAVMVNDHTAFRVDWMPFAGLRESGLGIGGIPYTMKDMQIEKMLVVRSGGL